MSGNNNTPPPKTTKELADKEENITDDEGLIRKTRLEHSQCVLSALFGNSGVVSNPRTRGGNSYKNFILLDSHDPSAMISMIHGMREADEFFRMPTKLAAHLVPKIRLFFLDKKNHKDEVLFSNADTIAANPDSQSFSLLSSNNRGGDAGIVEIQIEDLTSQPEEESNSLVCKIKLFFKTFADFTNPKVSSASGTRPYARLITRDDTRDAAYDPLENRIQLHVGYNVPDIPAQALDIPYERYNLIKKALLKSVRILNLTLREHTFSFNEDGSVELDITYNAALDGIYRDLRTDLLQSSDQQKRVSRLEQSIKAIKRKSGKLSDADSSTLQRFTKVISKVRSDAKDEAVSQFLEKLFGDPTDGKGKTYLKSIVVPAELIGAIDDDENIKSSLMKNNRACDEYAKLLKAVQRPAGAPTGKFNAGKEMVKAIKENKHLNSAEEDTSFTGQVSGFFGFDSGKKKRSKQIDEANGKFSIEYDVEVDADTKKRMQAQVGAGTEITKLIEITYFHYGDLMDVALDIMKRPGSPFHEAYIKGGMADVFPTPILGPLMVRETFCDGEVTRKSGGNIADLPISVDFFIDFMTTKIIKPMRNNLLFRDFVGMMNKELLPGCLGETCRRESSGNMIHFAHSMPLTVKKTSPTDPCLGFAGDPGRNYINAAFAKKRFNHVQSLSGPKGPNKTKDYMLIYVPGYVPALLPANRKGDLEKGIYHLYAGQPESSILNFSIDANNQPFLAEARTFPDGGTPNLGGDISGGARFDLNIEMLGNTFFRIGHYFYLDLSSVGLGQTNKVNTLANRLGVGGYYAVNKINYNITPSDFIIKITGLYQGGGKALEATIASAGKLKTRKNGNR